MSRPPSLFTSMRRPMHGTSCPKSQQCDITFVSAPGSMSVSTVWHYLCFSTLKHVSINSVTLPMFQHLEACQYQQCDITYVSAPGSMSVSTVWHYLCVSTWKHVSVNSVTLPMFQHLEACQYQQCDITYVSAPGSTSASTVWHYPRHYSAGRMVYMKQTATGHPHHHSHLTIDADHIQRQ